LFALREYSKVQDMSDPINWPRGEFTIDEMVRLNPAFPETVVRKKLADGIAAKSVVQTQKGNQKVKGTFQVVKTGETPAS
jgi:hypothetical protein